MFEEWEADIGKTLIYGLTVAIPTLIVAGLIFPEFIKNISSNPPKGLFETKQFKEEEMPSFGLSILTALIPVVLMGMATASELTMDTNSTLHHY